jgi:D-sedoheptulose 7-phosphate isomerase
VCGNGGSAATASHLTRDLVTGASYAGMRRFRILALTDSTPTLTAYANDASYEYVFSEQLKNFAEPGDLVVAISGSGNSPNVLRVIEYANSAGCRMLALTGRDGGKLGSLAQLNIRVPEPHMGRIEGAHMIVCHMISYYFTWPCGVTALGRARPSHGAASSSVRQNSEDKLRRASPRAGPRGRNRDGEAGKPGGADSGGAATDCQALTLC